MAIHAVRTSFILISKMKFNLIKNEKERFTLTNFDENAMKLYFLKIGHLLIAYFEKAIIRIYVWYSVFSQYWQLLVGI